MPDDVVRLPWTDDQWASLQRVVQEAAGKGRVASSFLPLAGPLAPGQASVPAQTIASRTLSQPQPGEARLRLEIDDSVTLPLTTVSCHVYLTTQQVEDPELASAKQLLARAADVVGRLEDVVVFNGQPKAGEAPPTDLPQIYQVHGGAQTAGLLSSEGLTDALRKKVSRRSNGGYGADLVAKVSEAVLTLESEGCFGPFACVLGHQFFEDCSSPFIGSLITPRDRIVPFLEGGPFLRSSVVPVNEGVVVSLAGSPIDLVIGSDVHVKFLQATLEPRYVLRVSERFVLRMKQPKARCRLIAEGNDPAATATTTEQSVP